ncbi:MAG: hypothetical protein MJ245_07565 [Clostridia bacterium]|nr:hypothetical protein [Clostridia bacterium]
MEEYRLYGALNAFDVWPCFLQPIFTDGNKLFFQKHADGLISGFEELRLEVDINDKIIPLNIDERFKIGSAVFNVVGFSKNDLVTGSTDDIIMDFNCNMAKYISNKDFAEEIKYYLVLHGA